MSSWRNAFCIVTLILVAAHIRAESISCSFEGGFIDKLVDIARKSPPSTWKIVNQRVDSPMTMQDGAILPGSTFSPANKSIAFNRELVMMLPGNAMLSDTLFELADKLVTNTGRQVLVYGYRGYEVVSKDKASLNSALKDTTALLSKLMASGNYDRGMVIGISFGGIAGLHALSTLKDKSLRVLLDSTPVSLPFPLSMLCPRSINVESMGTKEMLPSISVVFGAYDESANTNSAKEFRTRVSNAKGGVWKVDGQHVDIKTDVPGRLMAYEAFFNLPH